MSYIVAFVSYTDGGEVYATNCWRTDIQPGDAVVVRQETQDGRLKRAVVVKVEYLNWKCRNYIECLASEAEFDQFGITLPSPTPTVRGVCRHLDVWEHLKATGWSRHHTVSRLFKGGYSKTNSSQVANLFFRTNGIDIQIIEGTQNHALHGDCLSFGFCPTASVTRHTLSHSGLNVFQHVIDFSDAFTAETGDYSKFMSPALGLSDRRTEKLRQMAQEGRDPGLAGLYEALRGTCGYIGDGLSIGGRW